MFPAGNNHPHTRSAEKMNGDMPPPAPVHHRMDVFEASTRHEDYAAGDAAALDISQIDVNPDFGNSPDSMTGGEGNTSLNNLSFMSAHSPPESMPHFDMMGTTPYFNNLFSEEKPRLHKRKLDASQDEDDDDAMTGARLVSTFQETPSRLQTSFGYV